MKFLPVLLFMCGMPAMAQHALVLQSDFSEKDGAVAAMRGVAVGVSPDISMYDLTHEIPTYNIWEASIRLLQVAEYWPEGTVFVSVVDPGVGTDRKSVVLKTTSGHYFVTPDNGTLTFVAETLGIDAVREIDEAVNRLQNSEASYTFHGRDVYAYTGARLASETISFEDVGPLLPAEVVSIPYQPPGFADGRLVGNIPILDVRYGNVWTNIGRDVFERLNLQHGELVDLQICDEDKEVVRLKIPFESTFGAVELGEPLLYLNSLNNVSVALNQDSFASTYGIGSGASWSVIIKRAE